MSRLIVPFSARPPKRVRRCIHCEAEFPLEHLSRFVNHFEKCAAGLLEEDVKRRESNAFTGLVDPEAHRWIRKRTSEGKRGVKNGRPA